MFQNTVAALLAVLAAGLVADLVLWPRDQLPPIASVDQNAYFTPALIDRAQDFRGIQSWLGIAASLAIVIAPLVIALAWPRNGHRGAEGGLLSRWTDRRSGVLFGRGGSLSNAAVGAGVAGLALLAALPFQFIAFLRARDFGLSVESIPGWLWNWLLAALLTMLAVAVLAMVAGALIRRIARFWWLAFGVCLIALAVVFQALAPIVIEPLFADFTKAPTGALRSDVESLAKESGVDSGEVFTVDAANRTTGVNAYVTGLGTTKRVVIYDTLIRDFTPAERRQVIAHEFGHANYRDLVVGLLWFAFVALISLFAVDLMARALAERRGVEFESPAALAMVLAAALLAIAISQPAANAWSRAIEARADAFALRVTQQPATAISLERRLTIRNISRPQPPAVLQFLFGTHPDAVERIGMAVTVQRELAAGRVEPLP
ncbi:MAG: M48 family metalloprotease [Solirubrobacterales bacterium]